MTNHRSAPVPAAAALLSHDDLFAPADWQGVLERLSRATGLTVAMLDAQGELRVGPFTSSPLGLALIEAGAWQPQRDCRTGASQAVRAAVKTGTQSFVRVLDALLVSAQPLRSDGEPLGAIVAGYVPEAFMDPIVGDRLAQSLDRPFTQVWKILREQSPMGREQLQLHGELLRTVGDALLQSLLERNRERRRVKTLATLNEATRQLASATRYDQIATLSTRSAIALTGASRARLFSAHAAGESVAHAALSATTLEQTFTLRLPLHEERGLSAGHLELEYTEQLPEPTHQSWLAVLATQTGVALERTRVLDELHQERASLEAVNRLKDEFLATVSHELRTPLNAILGWAQLARSGRASTAHIHNGLEVIDRNARALSRLVGDLLDVSRIIAGKLRLELQSTSLEQVVDAAIESIFNAAQAKRISIQISRDDLEPLEADAARLQQVIWNLLSNAVKFTPAGGTIEVVLTHTGSAAQIEVSDSGPGIPASFLPHVFDRFRQADGATTRQHGGLGLGLAIVKHLVELHGGTIEARSPGRLGGASFLVQIPSLSERAMSRRSPPVSQSVLARLDALDVLVVDDDDDARSITALVLEGAGAHVRTATSAAEALLMIQQSPPRLMVADLSMPGEDGYSLIRRARAFAPDLPAIALTAHARVEDRIHTLSAGFAMHLAKPVAPDELIAAAASVSSRAP